MTRPTPRSLALVILLVLLSILGLRSWQKTATTLAVQTLCSQAEQAQWDKVLTSPLPSQTTAEELRTATECRCLALHATDQADTCHAELEFLLGEEPDAMWAPLPPLSEALIRARRARGSSRTAATLASRATTAFPNHLGLRILELETRLTVEEPSEVLTALEQRLPDDPLVRNQFRIWLADQSRRLGLAERALELLGPAPSPEQPNELFAWHEQRARALAHLGRSADLQISVGHWLESTPHQADVRALYALLLEEQRLQPATSDVASLLLASADESERIQDPWTREAVYRRVIMGLASSGRPEQALRWYDRARKEFALDGMQRSELERAAASSLADLDSKDAPLISVRFVVVPAVVGTTLSLSPGPQEAVDDSWSSHEVPPDGVLALDRRPGSVPQRWVLRDKSGVLLGSGAAWVRPGAEVEILPKPTENRDLSASLAPRAAADGQAKLFVIIPDCGDWRLIQYLRMRGDLPALNHFLETGYRAVLDSNPPFTGAALRSLVHPGGQVGSTVLGVLHELGAELEGLASVPINPLDGLRWILPQNDDLFGILGRGPLRAANLLYAHGNLAAGHHAQTVGPDGAEGKLPVARSSRPLSIAEAAVYPELAQLPHATREHVERL
ncbi:MAG TPA: hypothetical protein DIU15_16095, partial [Deltaproteobacteria bacterium]|nr:hypothetical protein [Deltaproteobacteria bacterium]